MLTAWRQAESQGYEVVRWYLSRRVAQRLAREANLEPMLVMLPMPVRLFDIPAEIVDAPDGFGMVVR